MPDAEFDPGPVRDKIVADEIDPSEVDEILAFLLEAGAEGE